MLFFTYEKKNNFRIQPWNNFKTTKQFKKFFYSFSDIFKSLIKLHQKQNWWFGTIISLWPSSHQTNSFIILYTQWTKKPHWEQFLIKWPKMDCFRWIFIMPNKKIPYNSKLKVFEPVWHIFFFKHPKFSVQTFENFGK